MILQIVLICYQGKGGESGGQQEVERCYIGIGGVMRVLRVRIEAIGGVGGREWEVPMKIITYNAKGVRRW